MIHILISLHRLLPLCLKAWSAMGNCFSLQKEHDTAIKFLQRAIQLDPDFTYAYTLLGHEYVLTEELDKGMSCFRTAIRLDSRHYNAWYGIAMISYKQENYQMAEKHFLRALQINPKHSVLLCHLAVVSIVFYTSCAIYFNCDLMQLFKIALIHREPKKLLFQLVII